MSSSQITGVRLLCILSGWAVGSLIFGTDATWLWDIKSYIWCGIAGGYIGVVLTTN